MANSSSDFVFYHYTPSLPAAAVFVALFGLLALSHLYLCVRTRTMYMIPLLIGGSFETVGYIGRIISHVEAPDYKLPVYILQSILLLIAPVLMAVSIYMVLGHIVTAVEGDSRCPIKKRFLTITFVMGDVLSFMVQSTGAGLLTKKEPDSKVAGKWIVVGGLAIQLIFFGLFMAVSIIFHRRLRKSPTTGSQSGQVPWRKNLCILYAASILIMVRSVFRIVEYIQGNDGYMLSREIWLYIFDAALMVAVMLLFSIVHPSEINVSVRGQRVAKFPLSVQKTESVQSSWTDDFARPQRETVAGQNPV